MTGLVLDAVRAMVRIAALRVLAWATPRPAPTLTLVRDEDTA